jgi:hypothetical protein
MSVTFARGASRLAHLVLLGALVSCSGELPNTASFDRQGERDYNALSAVIPIATLIRERDIRTPDESSAVPLLEQVRREVAKSDPNGQFAGVTYDLSGGNSLPKDWVVQSPTRWGHRADDLPLYPFDCKNCQRDVMLPACNSDADCPNGGTCGTIWAATSGAVSARR